MRSLADVARKLREYSDGTAGEGDLDAPPRVGKACRSVGAYPGRPVRDHGGAARLLPRRERGRGGDSGGARGGVGQRRVGEHVGPVGHGDPVAGRSGGRGGRADAGRWAARADSSRLRRVPGGISPQAAGQAEAAVGGSECLPRGGAVRPRVEWAGRALFGQRVEESQGRPGGPRIGARPDRTRRRRLSPGPAADRGRPRRSRLGSRAGCSAFGRSHVERDAACVGAQRREGFPLADAR